jgi:quinoprotein glucose dehydrogenase
VQLPGWVGGANWGGAAFDPESGRLFVPSLTSPTMVQLVKPDPEKSNFQLRRGGLMTTPSIDGLPVVKPPYGRVTALDLHQGTIAWMTPIGDGPRHHPHIAHLKLPPLGMETRGNPLVTQTLLFVAQGGGNLAPVPPSSTSGVTLPPPETRKLYALDKATGAVLWSAAPPIAGPMASPMTYLHQGRQYVVVATGAGLATGLVAYALPR